MERYRRRAVFFYSTGGAHSSDSAGAGDHRRRGGPSAAGSPTSIVRSGSGVTRRAPCRGRLERPHTVVDVEAAQPRGHRAEPRRRPHDDHHPTRPPPFISSASVPPRHLYPTVKQGPTGCGSSVRSAGRRNVCCRSLDSQVLSARKSACTVETHRVGGAFRLRQSWQTDILVVNDSTIEQAARAGVPVVTLYRQGENLSSQTSHRSGTHTKGWGMERRRTLRQRGLPDIYIPLQRKCASHNLRCKFETTEKAAYA